MTKSTIYYFLGLVSISIVGLFLYLFYWDMPDLTPKILNQKIVCQKTNEIFFLKQISQGLNNSSIILSADSITSYNEKSDFLFNADKIYYKLVNDTLQIISGSFARIPLRSNLKIPVKIEQIIENLDYINFEKNYLYKGYSKFPN